MSYKNIRSFFLLFSFLIFSFQNVFSNLLPGTVVQIGRDQYSYVENLSDDQLIVTLHEEFPREFHRTRIFELLKREKFSDKAVLVELKPEDGQAGLLMVGQDQYFHRQNAAAKLKPKLFKNVRRGKKKALKILLNALWVKAEDLKEGDKLVGKNGQTLYVTRVEPFEFKEEQDFYDISLKHHHLYYLVDTAGNHILTHNLDPFTIGVLIIAGCSLVGAIGTGFYKYKTSKRDGGATKKEIMTSALIGGGVGAAVGVAVGVAIVICIHYPTKILDSCSAAKSFIINHPTAMGIGGATTGGFGYLTKEAFFTSDPNEYKGEAYQR
ncbi:MAG: hypothetical protein ABIF12_00395 [bacterium]